MLSRGVSLCDSFSLTDIQNEVLKSKQTKFIRDGLYYKDLNMDIFVFKYGVIVLWGEDDSIEKFNYELFEEYSTKWTPPESRNKDDFSYAFGNDSFAVTKDHIYLDKNTFEIKQALSYVIGQSLKLSQLEGLILNTIDSTSEIPQGLAKRGRISKSKRMINKLRGELYLLHSSINLKFDLLDRPEFFWENPEYEHYYDRLEDYLEIEPRVSVLNKKLEVIGELLSMLSEELNHRHSSRLEWIIIWLITIELFIFIAHDTLKLF